MQLFKKSYFEDYLVPYKNQALCKIRKGNGKQMDKLNSVNYIYKCNKKAQMSNPAKFLEKLSVSDKITGNFPIIILLFIF